MAKFRSAVFSVIECLCYATVAGFTVMMIVWVCSGGTLNGFRLLFAFRMGFYVTVGIMVLREIILVAVMLKKHSKIDSILSKKGYCDKYYSLLRSETEKASGVRRRELQLYLAGELNDGGRLQEALEVLNSIDISEAQESFLVEYYNTYLYILLVNGDFKNAEIAYGAGMTYLEKYAAAPDTDGAVMHTLGVLEYSRGNFTKAENMFIRARSLTPAQNIVNACNMFLALVYLKTDRRDYAKKLTAETVRYVTNPRQQQEMKGLMRMVEKAYGL